MKMVLFFIVWSLANFPTGTGADSVSAHPGWIARSRSMTTVIRNSSDRSSSQEPDGGCLIASLRDEEDSFEEDLVAAASLSGCVELLPGLSIFSRCVDTKQFPPCTFLQTFPLRC